MNWDYISGYFDADGSVTLVVIHKGKNKTAQLSFSNNEVYTLEMIRDFIFEEIGVKGFIATKQARKETHSTNYELKYTYFPKCIPIAKMIKSKHAKKSKRLRILKQIHNATPRNGRYTPEQFSKREKLVREFFSY